MPEGQPTNRASSQLLTSTPRTCSTSRKHRSRTASVIHIRRIVPLSGQTRRAKKPQIGQCPAGGGAGQCHTGTCPWEGRWSCVFVFGPYRSRPADISCDCLGNWFVGKSGTVPKELVRGLFGNSRRKQQAEAADMKAGKYGIDSGYVVENRHDGCKCLCWLAGTLRPHRPRAWNAPDKTNDGIPTHEHPGFFEFPEDWQIGADGQIEGKVE